MLYFLMSVHTKKISCSLLMGGFITLISLNTTAQAPTKPTTIDNAMYFMSEVRDNEHCAMTVTDGNLNVSKKISNPALTCPDMTSWRLFANVIQDKFWSNWADETQNWPKEPWPLCTANNTAGKCCTPGANDNDKTHCPLFPGDKIAQSSLLKATPMLRIGRPSLTHHLQTLNSPEEIQQVIDDIKEAHITAAEAAERKECSTGVVDKLIPKTYASIGRVIRQTNAEITVRNKSFHDYLFQNNLYNSDGVAAVFTNNATNQQKNAPYAAQSTSANTTAPAKLSKIDFPTDAIMIKSNWLYDGLAKKLNINESQDAPFIKQKMTTAIDFTNEKGHSYKCNLTGTHYLMAFHVSSKDTPNWVWTTFEHTSLPGRCDVTGCNDSYGYSSTDKIPAGAAKNFVAPHTTSDNLAQSSTVFDRDKIYPAEQINADLDQVFKILGIGTTASTSKDVPAIADAGWRSYRLKGSQVEFTNSMGRKTVLGNSITEAGFIDGSSCITCHARAGAHINQKGGVDYFHLSVFTKNLSDYGYGLSAHSIPNPAWFHDDSNSGNLEVLQTDFVWGFFNANPLVKKP